MDLTGLFPPMITPVIDESGAIDNEAVESFTQFLVDAGVHGLFPAGSIGEFPGLTREQRADLIKTVVESSADLPVIAGCGGTSLTRVRSLVSDASDAGADAAIVVTPYYFNATQEGLCSFYEILADDSTLPVVLYNIPRLTGQRLTRESISRLASHPDIVGLKDTSRDFEYFANIRRAVPDSFSMLQASPELAIPSLDVGADGLIPGPANVLPGTLVDLYEAHRANDRGRTNDILQTFLLPIMNTTRQLPSSPTYKYLVRKRGFDVGVPLPPLQPLTDAQRERLDTCYRDLIEPSIGYR